MHENTTINSNKVNCLGLEIENIEKETVEYVYPRKQIMNNKPRQQAISAFTGKEKYQKELLYIKDTARKKLV